MLFNNRSCQNYRYSIKLSLIQNFIMNIKHYEINNSQNLQSVCIIVYFKYDAYYLEV